MSLPWLDIKNNAGLGEIYIYGDITDVKWYDEDVTPTGVKDELSKLNDVDAANLYVNSYGGNVFAGVAIYNELKRFNKPLTGYVDGIAASISSLIVLAADKVVMPSNAMYMIHNAVMCACGDYKEFRALADKLEKIQATTITEAYAKKTGLSTEKLTSMMDDETWLSGEEAVKLGFADELAEEMKVAACYKGNNVQFNNVEVQLNRFKAFPKAKFTEHKSTTNQLEQRHRHTLNMLSANN